MSYWELIAALLSLAYIFLALKQNPWCWVTAFFSTLIYAVLFFDATLLMSSFLNTYYLIMAIYGFYSWKYTNQLLKQELKISTINLQTTIKIVLVFSILSFIVGYIMENNTNASFAYLDSVVTVFSLVTTFLMAKKVLQAWLYWVVIDAFAVYLYFQKEFYITSLIFLIYTIMALFAYFSWKKEYLNELK